MKKVKDARKKTAIGQKRFAKALKRKHKKYNPGYTVHPDTVMAQAFEQAKQRQAETLTL